MTNEIEIWYKKKLQEGVSKADILNALKQQNYTESQLKYLSNQMDLYIDEISNMKHNKEDFILSKKLQIEADLSSWYQMKLSQGHDRDHIISELQKHGYDNELINRITK